MLRKRTPEVHGAPRLDVLDERKDERGEQSSTATRAGRNDSHVERGEFDVVAIPAFDRFGRSALVASTTSSGSTMSVSSSSRCVSPSIPTGQGKFQRLLLLGLAELESDIRGECVAAAHEQRRARGLHNGRAKYGYRRVLDLPRGERGRIEPEPVEAEIARRVFSECSRRHQPIHHHPAANADRVKPRHAKEWNQAMISTSAGWRWPDENGKPWADVVTRRSSRRSFSRRHSSSSGPSRWWAEPPHRKGSPFLDACCGSLYRHDLQTDSASVAGSPGATALQS